MGAGFSLLFPSLALLVVNRVPEERRGVAMGTFTAFFDLGMGVGSPIVGAAAAIGGYEAAFVLAAACALATIAVALSLRSVAAAIPAPLGRGLVDQAAALSWRTASRHIANENTTSTSTRRTSTASKPKAAPRTSSTSW